MKKKRKLILFSALLGLVAMVFVLNWLLLNIIPNQEQISEQFTSLGAVGLLIYLGWGTLSVVFTPLNFSWVALAGGFVYGTWIGFLINWICKLVGNFIAFAIAQKYGRSVLKYFFAKNELKKYDKLISNENSILLYFVLAFIPLTPSDTIAYIVGLSSLKKSTFLIVAALGNIGTCFALAFVGSKDFVSYPWVSAIMVPVFGGGLWYIHKHRKKFGLSS